MHEEDIKRHLETLVEGIDNLADRVENIEKRLNELVSPVHIKDVIDDQIKLETVKAADELVELINQHVKKEAHRKGKF